MGVMATCPPDSELPIRKSGPPGAFGGNLDCKELKAGSTLYLPVFQKGALTTIFRADVLPDSFPSASMAFNKKVYDPGGK